MSEALDEEIRTLRSLYWSERDPEGRGFASLVDAYRRAGDARQAFELLRDGLERHPDFATGHVVAARLFLDKGLIEEGELAARSALELDADNVDALASLVRALEARDALSEAVEVRKRLRKLEPSAVPPEDRPVEQEPPPVEVHAEREPELEEPGLEASEHEPEAGAEVDAEPWAEEEVSPWTEEPSGTPVELVYLETEPTEAAEVEVEAREAETTFDVEEVAEEAAVEPVADVAARAPEEPEEPVADIATLAPEEALVDVATLAPDEPEEPDEPAVDIGALAPEEPVADVATLAPGEPEEADEPAVDIGALAPEEPVADVATLAPLVDVASLAAGEPEEDDDIWAWVPEDRSETSTEPEEEPVESAFDIADLAPDEPEEEPVVDVATLPPDTADDVPREPPPRVVEPASAPARDALREPIPTRTMAELYVEQGFLDRARDIYVHLRREKPGNASIEARIREIEQMMTERSDEEAETQARDLAESGAHEHEVDTPFAWTDDEADDTADGPAIGDFFEKLFRWEPRRRGVDP